MKKLVAPEIFNIKDLGENATNELEQNGFFIRVFHQEADPQNAHRIRFGNKMIEAELLPSKGMSLAQAWINGQALFWEAPIDLIDTENLELWSDEISINGQAAPGFTFLKTLIGGLEFYGLRNWGMPATINGKEELLHGETSNIPVNEILFASDQEDQCWIQASFMYRTFEGNLREPWYERGEAIYKVTRKYCIQASTFEIMVEDSIENISKTIQRPDWGYHITFRPEEGARLLVPSKHAEERGGSDLPDDIETWYKAEDPSIRPAPGIIHKNLLACQTETGPETVSSLLNYPDGTGLSVSVPPSPYFQTWFCNGGKGSKEFTEKNGDSILRKNWDGMGLEIGSSALDHNGNTDKGVSYEPDLSPGSSITIPLRIQWLDKNKTKELAERISRYKDKDLQP